MPGILEKFENAPQSFCLDTNNLGPVKLADLLQTMVPKKLDPGELDSPEGLNRQLLSHISDQLELLPPYLSQCTRSFIIDFLEDPKGKTFHEARKTMLALPQLCDSLKKGCAKEAAIELGSYFDTLGKYRLENFLYYPDLSDSKPPAYPDDPDTDIWHINKLIGLIEKNDLDFDDFLNSMDHETIQNLQGLYPDLIHINNMLSGLPDSLRNYSMNRIRYVLENPSGHSFFNLYKFMQYLPHLPRSIRKAQISDKKLTGLMHQIGSAILKDYGLYKILSTGLLNDFFKEQNKPQFVKAFSRPNPLNKTSELWQLNSLIGEINTHQFNFKKYLQDMKPRTPESYPDSISAVKTKIRKLIGTLPVYWRESCSQQLEMLISHPDGQKLHALNKLFKALPQLADLENEKFKFSDKETSAELSASLLNLSFYLFEDTGIYKILESAALQDFIEEKWPALAREFAPLENPDASGEIKLIKSLVEENKGDTFSSSSILKEMRPRKRNEYEPEIIRLKEEMDKCLGKLPKIFNFLSPLIKSFLEKPEGAAFNRVKKWLLALPDFEKAQSVFWKITDGESVKQLTKLFEEMGWYIFENFETYVASVILKDNLKTAPSQSVEIEYLAPVDSKGKISLKTNPDEVQPSSDNIAVLAIGGQAKKRTKIFLELLKHKSFKEIMQIINDRDWIRTAPLVLLELFNQAFFIREIKGKKVVFIPDSGIAVLSFNRKLNAYSYALAGPFVRSLHIHKYKGPNIEENICNFEWSDNRSPGKRAFWRRYEFRILNPQILHPGETIAICSEDLGNRLTHQEVLDVFSSSLPLAYKLKLLQYAAGPSIAIYAIQRPPLPPLKLVDSPE